MQRRHFLKKLSVGAAGAAVTAIPAATIAAVHKSREATDTAKENMSKRFKSIEKRLDRIDRNHKRTLKMVLGVAALSVGMDLSILL